MIVCVCVLARMCVRHACVAVHSSSLLALSPHSCNNTETLYFQKCGDVKYVAPQHHGCRCQPPGPQCMQTPVMLL